MVLKASHSGTIESSRTRGTQVQNSPLNNPKHSQKLTREQFKQWLDEVDINNDGYISWNELYGALKVLGLKWKTLKVWRAMKKIDLNHNKVIDIGKERDMLVDHAEKYWGIIQTDY
ncbi:EF-hand domain-containing protein [Carex littledalei]|uniref:EF-hand domain-containing protein n=1 Tax=Carex littledalei TaxID=544730 RepID=A0A833W0U3_9POAL|nr:EF-hand domain-containing protein [Carex littledalei]